ncbi:MAG: hypothetical protein ACI8RD_006947, partial [Bacillariaceae sp.]
LRMVATFSFFSFRNLFYYNILNLIFFSLILVGPKISKKQKKKQVWQSVQEWELSSYHTTFSRKCLPRQPLTYLTGRLITRLVINKLLYYCTIIQYLNIEIVLTLQQYYSF